MTALAVAVEHVVAAHRVAIKKSRRRVGATSDRTGTPPTPPYSGGVPTAELDTEVRRPSGDTA